VQIPESIFASIRTLTATIALEMAYAQEQHAGALYVAGGLLLVIVTALVLVARHISREETHA
jgi:phosphate transport system permease protein